MATGAEWRQYFEQFPTPLLKQQIKEIEHSLTKLNRKIVSEFQLVWLNDVKFILSDIVRQRSVK